jgi:hypothetical protein
VPDIQRVHGTGAGTADASVQQVIQGARGGGQLLPAPIRTTMGKALGADFGGVRLHTDAQADQLARSVRAQAFTTGQHIFFRRGQYTHTSAGRQLLAHELTHVVQQRGAGSTPMIQRRMGFEFETLAEVRGTFFQAANAGPHAFELFDDDEEFYRPNGARWKIVPDTGRMEFVTDALNTRQDLQAVAGQIAAFINSMQGVTRAQDIRATHPGAWTPPARARANPNARPNYTVHVGSDPNFTADAGPTDWYGQPQVSLGVATGRLSRFFTEGRDTTTLAPLQAALPNANPAPPMPDPQSAGIPAGLQNITQLMNWWHPALVKGEWITQAILDEATTLVNAHAGALPQVQKNKLHGLWTLMRAYWRRLVHAVGAYKKSKLLTMARTDFHSFYNDLSPSGKQAFRAAQGAFVGVNAQMIPGTNITLTRWYASVIQPEQGSTYVSGNVARSVDLLSANRAALQHEAISTGTDKSMGQYPLDTIGGVPRIVFELRRVTPGVRIPIGLMYQEVLLPIFEFINRIET